MKRKVLFVLLALGVAVLASAHGRGRGGFPSVQPAETVTVTGNLTIAQGSIAVQNNDITYLAAGLHRFIGFIDGLKEGARVTLDGSAFTNPQNEKIKFLLVSKLTINGKAYDLAPAPGPGAQSRWFGPHGRKW
ncbi:MAG: hypothetical protein LBT13_07335 [Treponema sp.]|jgi:hypothetical protein|nr:hypothetical protein [Treponema sp.]